MFDKTLFFEGASIGTKTLRVNKKLNRQSECQSKYVKKKEK